MKDKLSVLFAILAFIVVFSLFSTVFKAEGSLISKWRVTGGAYVGQAIQAPFSDSITSPGLYVYEATFPATRDDCIVIPRPMGHAFRVEVNGKCVGEKGNFSNPTAIIWNSVYDFPLPDECKYQTNHIKITNYGLHDTGLSFVPYTAVKEKIGYRLDFQNGLTQGVALFMFGSYFTLIIFMLMLAYRTERYRLSYLYFAISNVAALLYELDILESRQLGSIATFFILRKIFLCCLYVCALFLLMGLYEFFSSGRKPYIVMALPVILGTSLVLAPNFYWLQKLHGFGALLLVLTLAIFLFQNYKRIGKVLTFSFAFFFLCVVQSIGVMLVPLYQPLLFQIGLFAIFIGFTITVSKKIILSDQEAIRLKRKTVTDSLTGAFNRQYLDSLSMEEDDCLAFFDVDDLKRINDVEGHSRGDEVIREVAEAMLKEVRRYDAVVRYGGDEFVVIFRRTDSKVCHERIKSICTFLENREFPIHLSWGMATYQGNLKDTIALADNRMYEMKHRNN